MESNNEIQKIEKQALNVFLLLALVVYAAAIGYCYITNRLIEMGIVSVAVAVLALLVMNTYKSFNNN